MKGSRVSESAAERKRRELRRVEREETEVRMYCVREDSVSRKGSNKKRKKRWKEERIVLTMQTIKANMVANPEHNHFNLGPVPNIIECAN